MPLICSSPQKAFCGSLHGYLWSSLEDLVSTLHRLVQEGLCLIFSDRRYLWSPPKFYITRTCPRGGHGADATDHSAVGLDQATGRPDKTEHALLAFQKAKENTNNNVKIKANTNIDIYKHRGLFQARVRALKTEFTIMII